MDFLIQLFDKTIIGMIYSYFYHNMHNNMSEIKIICLAGATGSGKSALAAKLGHELDGVVINADSRQFYADFPIITAQPGPDETALCPHLLYGCLPATQKMSAGQYAQKASACIDEVLRQGKIPIVTGGTGLYFRALMHGIADIPPVPREVRQKWQEQCRELGSHALYDSLRNLDPDYAAKIHPNDRQRITRAMEVAEATGKNLTWWHQSQSGKRDLRYLYLGLGATLKELEPVLRRRIDVMLDNGALEEAKAALRHCADPKAPGWSGIGCAELFRALAGELTIGEAKDLWYKNTRAYAKRQLTWFRGEPDLRWIEKDNYNGILRMIKNLTITQG